MFFNKKIGSIFKVKIKRNKLKIKILIIDIDIIGNKTFIKNIIYLW